MRHILATLAMLSCGTNAFAGGLECMAGCGTTQTKMVTYDHVNVAGAIKCKFGWSTGSCAGVLMGHSHAHTINSQMVTDTPFGQVTTTYSSTGQ